MREEADMTQPLNTKWDENEITEMKAFARSNQFAKTAVELVRAHVERQFDKSDPTVPDFDVYVVWFCKVLQNWKALVSTTLPDQMYYEISHNGDDQETYIDCYKKVWNLCVKD
jgi:Family of unknown function (DUF6275)